jgi:rod shape-determining protein MreC
MLISASIKRCNAFGTVLWQGNNPFVASLKYIPRHIKPIVGDTVVTSDYSTVFPSGLPIGKIKRLKINDNEFFYDIDVALSTDLSTISYVYVIANTLKAERDSLQSVTSPDLNEH